MKRILIVLLQVLLLAGYSILAYAGEEKTADAGSNEASALDGQDAQEDEGTDYKDQMQPGGLLEETQESLLEEYVDLAAIQAEFLQSADDESLSFGQMVRALIRGELPFDIKELPDKISGLFLDELRQQKHMALQILVIVLASAIFSNFVRVFENSQIADISFYMMYLLISTLLIKSFLEMNEIVVNTCGAMNNFMKILLPSYLVTVVLCSGTVSALGFYEIALLGMNFLQIFIVKIVLPAINFYLILLILGQLSKEDYFSRFAELLETVIGWIIKTALGVVIGLQAVQCLIAPAVDSMKNTAVQRLAKAIPGVGTVLDSAIETVTGSAVVLKNAVGVAGILALAVICLTPLVKLGACILLFRLLCALIQPVTEKRMVDGIESISRSAVLLLKVLVAGLSIFIISLAMITAATKGG